MNTAKSFVRNSSITGTSSFYKPLRGLNFNILTTFLLVLSVLFNNLSAANLKRFTTTNVTFTSSGISLSGTIFKPDHATAAVVIVHGSGQEKRMTEFATLLADNGIAVLTYDKRGVGESGGVYAGP
ncbi:alpha/beta hydrolase, partial [Chryseobacterium artocarpi]|uniref:alpha/beta hydrolase n=1 Tax=Chryseobacterium artocarpi TaxID=1414727 RepID=UPI003F2F8A59